MTRGIGMTKTHTELFIEQILEGAKNLVICKRCRWSGKLSQCILMLYEKPKCPRCGSELKL